jgi:hypothetical protein
MFTLLKQGEMVYVKRHNSRPHPGLSYPELQGVLLQDVNSQGWDVVNILTSKGEVSVYAFSILSV